MKKIVTTALVILLSGCASPHLHNTNTNDLQISFKDQIIIQGKGDIIYENKINLINLQIEQKVFLMKDSSVLSYEDASLASSYEFSYGINRTVGILFPQYKYTAIDFKGNLHFYKLESKEDVEYLILENMNKKRIKMVYGLNKTLFDAIYKKLILEKNIELSETSISRESISEDKASYVKSKWSHKSIILDSIIRKVGNSRIGK